MNSTQEHVSPLLEDEHWSTKYIGLPWANGARGPKAFDCWGLVWYVYLKERNIKLPLHTIDAQNLAACARAIKAETNGGFGASWSELSKPVEFAGVAMGHTDFSHVGIYTEADGGLILHSSLYENVVASRPAVLQRTRYPKIKYYGLHR